MKAVLLAGGYGSRLSEETAVRPKPMVEIGGRPILWHIMKLYTVHGITDFVVCAGYKGEYITDWLEAYRLHSSSALRFHLGKGEVEYLTAPPEDWTVTVVDTGRDSMTGGRLRRVRPFLDDETFCVTYGDGVSDVDIGATIKHHHSLDVDATMTIVQPPGRFGAVTLSHTEERVGEFMEKPSGDGSWINGGFFVVEPRVLDRIDGDDTVFEQGPLRDLAREGRLGAFRHEGFWQPMDTLRDKNLLEGLWASGEAPWKSW